MLNYIKNYWPGITLPHPKLSPEEIEEIKNWPIWKKDFTYHFPKINEKYTSILESLSEIQNVYDELYDKYYIPKDKEMNYKSCNECPNNKNFLGVECIPPISQCHHPQIVSEGIFPIEDPNIIPDFCPLRGKKIRRINIFGGPSSGKSTLASYIFYSLKSLNISVELLLEYIKLWTYVPIKPQSFDTFYCLSKQLHKEDMVLRNNPSIITISDSPLYLNCFYANYRKDPGFKGMMELAKEMEEKYPSVNIFLKRDKDKKYNETGRYHSKEESDQIEYHLLNFLNDNNISLIDSIDKDEIFKEIMKEIKK